MLVVVVVVVVVSWGIRRYKWNKTSLAYPFHPEKQGDF
jgi:hypothetical protein